jgi:hypothetical protein
MHDFARIRIKPLLDELTARARRHDRPDGHRHPDRGDTRFWIAISCLLGHDKIASSRQIMCPRIFCDRLDEKNRLV